MRVLIVGGGGREHALAWKISQSPLCSKLYIAPGHPLMSGLGECVDIAADDLVGLKAFAKKNEIDLTVVGPEKPLVMGIVDSFEEVGLKIFGPSQAASMLEGSKKFAKDVMKKHLVPTATFESITSASEAREVFEVIRFPLVIKTDGLAAGKGVFICEDLGDADKALRAIFAEKRFGGSGESCIIEEFLVGEEASLFVLTDGHTVQPLLTAQDHKRVGEGDVGPNTGGMGSYAPAPVMTPKVFEWCMKEIVIPTIHGMNSDGRPYKGVLYIGLMVRGDTAKVVEYNCRFGDPECQPLMMLMKSDILPLLMQVAEDNLDDQKEIEWHEGSAMGVVLASEGYPGSYKKGLGISGLRHLPEDVIPFAAGVAGTKEIPVTSGGRVFCVTSRGENLEEARDKVYANIDKIFFDGSFYRKDIGHRVLGSDEENESPDEVDKEGLSDEIEGVESN